MQQALKNIRVLDFTRVLAGPYCTMLLADMGAEVIKVEMPNRGDDTRHFGPFQNNESGYFMFLNRGKKSITLDLKNPESIQIVKQLVRESDVVVENFRPGVMKKLGLDYKSLKDVNPQLIYASISGFGQSGPYSKRPAYDLVAQAMGGLASITGHENNPPTRTGASLGDMSAALYAAYGIMVALFHRLQTNQGQFLDIAMMDTVFSLLESNVMRYTTENVVPERIGSRHPISSPFDIYKAKDGYVVIAIANDSLFYRLCTAMDRPDLITHEKFKIDPQRTKYERDLKEILEEWLQQYNVSQVVEQLNDFGIPCSPIMNIQEVCEDQHIKEREMLVEMEHPLAGKVKIVGNPVKLSETPPVIKESSPLLGEHTADVLKEILHLTDYELTRLKEEKIFS
ncbi:CaiB/BaiF CoA transferase family protein [Bacillus paramycoides]|uniref:CaiB/BaiF CoA transferase family protein n=1 Tax=Bacillus paramycoides TaxID=2026194 RepID=UPI003D06B23D